ncbi:protein of unknown function [Modestobacter italicus]|uniref:Uncharacterized protein n=1 Tax=Modestobacter italicus (strain DSM 44449 / CECT 9708 / BC 501) TaxID=2732864 RepID=I4F0H9_MODI5|nr:protein of unknown function [Modestobacter marinus]
MPVQTGEGVLNDVFRGGPVVHEERGERSLPSHSAANTPSMDAGLPAPVGTAVLIPIPPPTTSPTDVSGLMRLPACGLDLSDGVTLVASLRGPCTMRRPDLR